MDFPVEHLRTFATIIAEGSFEGAARQLHLTPSAISQRVRAMEERVGSVLLQRTRPVRATEAGTVVLRAARQLEHIVGGVARELGEGHASVISLVVNADSLVTWFVPALARAAREIDCRFEVLRADESVSAEELRRGEAMAAVTATREAVPGCTSTPLGNVRYLAVANAGFAEQHFGAGVTAAALAAAPMLEFDRHDGYQARFIRRHTRSRVDPPKHLIPSSAEFALAIELGLGWGMLPEGQCKGQLAEGRLVTLGDDPTLDQPLFWQRWNLASPMLDRLTDIVVEEASLALRGRATLK